MPTLPDTSEWFTPERALNEEVQWVLQGAHKQALAWLLPLVEQHEIKSVIEFGCGSGIMAAGLSGQLDYLGLDKNEWFLERARARNAAFRTFLLEDVRHHAPGTHDLVLAWSFLKNFALDEWDDLLRKVLSSARFAAFNMQLLARDLDNGTEFHHVFVTLEHMHRVIQEAGHEIVTQQQLSSWVVQDVGEAYDVAYWTKRVKEPAQVSQTVIEAQVDAGPRCPRCGSQSAPEGGYRRCWSCNFTWGSDTPAPEPEPPTDLPPVLEIGGVTMTDLHPYALRWLADGTPVLYEGGRRVTESWRLTLAIHREKDDLGRSA